MFLDTLFSDNPNGPVFYAAVVVVTVVSIVLHELGHALAATWEGDPTPKIRGHLTWDPRVHMGWVSIALVLIAGIGFGATPVTRSFFRHRRWGEAIVSFAGPAVNLALFLFGSLVYVICDMTGAPPFVMLFWWVLVRWNIVLFLFNMIPIPPFDGFGVLDGTFDLGEFGARVRGFGVLTGWVLAAALVNFGVLPVFAWGERIADVLIGSIRGAVGGA